MSQSPPAPPGSLAWLTPDEVRTLALALPGTEETPHFDRASFRVKSKIFATLAPEGGSLVLKLPPLVRESLLQSHPQALLPLEDRWSRTGWTRMVLQGIERPLLSDLIRLAWTQVAPKALQGRT